MAENPHNIQGLTPEQVENSRDTHGHNKLDLKKETPLWDALKTVISEPMILLLFAAAFIYFLTGNHDDGIFLSVAIILVATISLFQDARSRSALEKLKAFTRPTCQVIRDGKTLDINIGEIVIGDFIIVNEGSSIPADAEIVQSNDFSVNESILTGEAFSVPKSPETEDNTIYMGTQVETGLAIARVTAIGNKTQLGKIGKSLEDLSQEKTPLEIQINNFVKKMVIAGSVVFILVWAINYIRTTDVLESLLMALTLAMSILPEEIPVAFTTFMAMGAWRLMKMGIVVKQMKTVETLGSATVICTDKTGTITQNKMSLAKIYTPQNGVIEITETNLSSEIRELLETAMWASEPIPFDAMEVALHNSYQENFTPDHRAEFKMYHEYPLEGKPPMMTHIFENKKGKRIIAAKGAPEAILEVSALDEEEKNKIIKVIDELAKEGYRLLGVAETSFSGDNFPNRQQDFEFRFKGLVSFYDPPKANIGKVFQDFYSAGIKVKIVTGDNPETTAAVARQVGFNGHKKVITGAELMQMDESKLRSGLDEYGIFARMFPEAKLRIIEAFKANGEIVAMTGDGVNDGPALKASHIGIAMGKKGSEIAKQAASLILQEDDLSKMVQAVEIGRKIYTNLKKAIQYIISIHIPIILTVFIPLALAWKYPAIFSPVHIIFLELIMGPTCSIIYENEPPEKNSMQKKPRPFTSTFFNGKELTVSIIQGLIITLGCLFIYQFAVENGFNENTTRTMVFSCLISANIFLTLVNRSFYYSAWETLKYKNILVPLIIGISVLITGIIIYIPFFSRFFDFEKLNFQQLGFSIIIGFISVIWFEGFKYYRRKKPLQAQEI
ncbi:cation-translocating P-type ATPase [Salegentibacter flavus]|uniref:Ca2+-transporting ATPase n=1 Tax=Salegentibacter flavus TaxID=287099 RepID=A0A1I5BS55_9FLAO|nr:cation-translocating P-type ATPase [Salegentibacter flavus]SFN77550.1 Ca2+-transporting ATPase [Salegentibacter flavus]